MTAMLIALADLETTNQVAFRDLIPYPKKQDEGWDLEARQMALAPQIFDPETRVFLAIDENFTGMVFHKKPINGDVETFPYVKDAIEVRFGRTADAMTIITLHIPEKLLAKYGEERIDEVWKFFARGLPQWNTMRVEAVGKTFDPTKIGRLDKVIRGGELPEGFVRKVMATINGVHFYDVEAEWLAKHPDAIPEAYDMALARNADGHLCLNVAYEGGIYFRNLDFKARDVAREHRFEIGRTACVVPGFGSEMLAVINGRLIKAQVDDWHKGKAIPALFDFEVTRVAKKHNIVVIQTRDKGLLAKYYDQLEDAKIPWTPYIGNDVIESTGKDNPLELVGTHGRSILASAHTPDGTLATRRFPLPQQAMGGTAQPAAM